MIIIFFLLSFDAVASVYCVDALNGNDANTGVEKCWQTINKVNQVILAPGSTVGFQSGQTWTGQLKPRSSGIPGTSITFTIYGEGAMPVINGIPNGYAIVSSDKSYLTFSNLDLRIDPVNGKGAIKVSGCKGGIEIDGVVTSGSPNKNVKNIEISNCPNFKVTNSDIESGLYGIYVNGFPGVIEYNKIHGQDDGDKLDWDSVKCTGRKYADGLIIRHNDISGFNEDGIDSLFCGGVLIEENYIHDNGFKYQSGNPSGIKLMADSGAIVRGNRIKNITAYVTGGRGVFIGEDNDSWHSRNTGNLIQSNLFLNVQTYGVWVGGGTLTGIYNNMIVSGNTGIRAALPGTALEVKNNMIQAPAGACNGVCAANGAVINGGYNVFTNQSSGAANSNGVYTGAENDLGN